MMSLDYAGFIKALEPHKIIGLTAPASADGDSVGTQCALKEILEDIYPSKKIRIIVEEPCPKRYSFLKEAAHFELSEDVVKEDSTQWPDAMVCVDGSTSRIGEHTTKIWQNAKLGLQVDHHAISDGAKFDFKLCDANAAATTVIIFRMIEALKIKLTKDIAQSIYMGLIFDTGLFKHSNTTPDVMMIGARLLEQGFNHTETAEKALLIKSPNTLKLLKEVLNNTHFDLDDKFTWAVITQDVIHKTQAGKDDRDGLIDHLFLTEGTKVACLLFEESSKVWKLSFRSRGPNVAAVAQNLNPQGGGHKLASGCTLEGSSEEIIKNVLAEMSKVIDEVVKT